MTDAVEATTTAPVQTDTAGSSSQQATPPAAAAEGAAPSQQQPVTQPAKPEPQKPAAPAEYKEFKLPEGMAKDSPVLAELISEAKTLGLPQEAAQRLIDREGKRTDSIKQAALDASVKWAEQAQIDKEYGGDKFKENLAYVGKALSEFATPEMGELLKTTGLINHPEMLRVFYRIGKAMSADNKVVIGGAGNTPPKSPAQRMYPNMNP